MGFGSFRSKVIFGVALFGLSACGSGRLISTSAEEEEEGAESEATSATSDTPGESEEEESGEETGVPQPTSDSTDFVPDIPSEPESCDPWGEGCPEGEKCVPYASSGGGNWDAHKCVPILGDAAPGEPCTSTGTMEATDNCDATSICWDVQEVDGELVGYCAAQCTGTPDDPMCEPGSLCQIGGDSTLALCIPICDPLEQDCTIPTTACYWANHGFQCIFTTENILAGEPCGFVNDCAPGLMCVTGEGLPVCESDACCTSYCELGLGDASCEAAVPGTVCSAFWEEGAAEPGYEHIGICVSPP